MIAQSFTWAYGDLIENGVLGTLFNVCSQSGRNASRKGLASSKLPDPEAQSRGTQEAGSNIKKACEQALLVLITS